MVKFSIYLNRRVFVMSKKKKKKKKKKETWTFDFWRHQTFERQMVSLTDQYTIWRTTYDIVCRLLNLLDQRQVVQSTASLTSSLSVNSLNVLAKLISNTLIFLIKNVSSTAKMLTFFFQQK